MPIASQVERREHRLRIILTTPVWTPKPTKVVHLERNSRPFVNFTNKESHGLLVENNGRTLHVFSFVNDGSLGQYRWHFARVNSMEIRNTTLHRISPLCSFFRHSSRWEILNLESVLRVWMSTPIRRRLATQYQSVVSLRCFYFRKAGWISQRMACSC